MTTDEIIIRIQKAYGDYNQGQGSIVKSWLNSYKGDLNVLYAEILRSVSWQYKTPPGPKEFEDCKKTIFKANIEASRPELQEYKPLQIDENYLPREEAAEMLSEIMKPLFSKNVRRNK